MKTYWDYQEHERAEMSMQDVEQLLDVELMTKGVAKVEPPEYITDNVPAMPDLTQKEYFQIGDCDLLFATSQQAAAVLKQNPLKTSYNYNSTGYDYKYPVQVEPVIKTILMYDPAELGEYAKRIQEVKRIQGLNAELKSDYEKATKAQNEVFQGVWDDWNEQRNRLKRMQRIQTTYDEYVKMADGNATAAKKFLVKTYSRDDIIAASLWFQQDMVEPEQSTEDTDQ